MKIKTLWKGLLIAIAVIMTAGLLMNVFVKKAPSVKPKTYDFSITYIRADTGEDVLVNYDFMLKENGTYPKGYNENSATFTISDLLGKMKPALVSWGDEFEGVYVGAEVSDPKNRNKSYGFYGWYLDKDCTIEFEGTVREGAAENLVLYAKISESTWFGG